MFEPLDGDHSAASDRSRHQPQGWPLSDHTGPDRACRRPPKGCRPFHSARPTAILYDVVHQKPNYDLIPAGLDYDGLLPILKKSFAKNSKDRYADAHAMSEDVQRVLAKLGARTLH